MILLKENKIKQRQVWKLDNCIQKRWYSRNIDWLEDHISILDNIFPNYVISYGKDINFVYANFEILPGTVANVIPHTEDFVLQIYDFCIENIKSTYPYAHGDWVLSNMIVNDKNVIKMCDWDNIGIYSKEEILNKLHSDLSSAFGTIFNNIRNKL